ncbi:MAG: hypothetical protein ACN2B6_02955 [Rickettsiales bacterium]
MSEQGGMTGADLFARGIGQSSSSGGDSKVNDQTTVDAVFDDGAEMAAGTAARLTGGLLPANIGKTSALANISREEGTADKKILEGGILRDAPGGFLAKLFHDIFIKTLARKEDHTEGVGGGQQVEAMAGSDAPSIEPSSNNASFQDLVGQAGSMGSFASADMGGSAEPIAPMPVGGGGRSGGSLEV